MKCSCIKNIIWYETLYFCTGKTHLQLRIETLGMNLKWAEWIARVMHPEYVISKEDSDKVIAIVLWEILQAGCTSMHVCLDKCKRDQMLIFDFLNSATSQINNIGDSNQFSQCVGYTTVKEEGIGVTFQICAGDTRKRHVYTSSTHELEIVVGSNVVVDTLQFIVEFEGIWNKFINCFSSIQHVQMQCNVNRFWIYLLCQCMV